MSKVIFLREYKEKQRLNLEELSHEVGKVVDVDVSGILKGDFSDFNDTVRGLLAIKDILHYHLEYVEDWKHYLLCLLEHVHEHGGADRQSMKQTLYSFRRFINEETDVINRGDMKSVLQILDHIESPKPRGRLDTLLN